MRRFEVKRKDFWVNFIDIHTDWYHVETFRLHVGDVHCKHIVFCGSTDNGYARLLGPYSGAEATCSRITMVEGAPFERELAELKDKFCTTSFPVVFRDTKLPPGRRVSFSATA